MTGVFINYRNSDEPYAAALIDETLKGRFGSHNVFRASRSNTPGNDFRTQILGRLRECTVLIAVIGNGWLDTRDAEGRQRLFQSEDWVRGEIALAFAEGLHVVPVYVTGAAAPQAHELPVEMEQLAHQHGVRLHHRSVGTDLERLAAAVERWVPDLRLDALLEPASSAPPWGLPSALLRPEHQVVPFEEPAGRQGLKQLAAWCERDGSAPVLLVTGAAGQGKSRLARRLCERLRAERWTAGLVSPDSPSSVLERIRDVVRPALLVFDAAESRQEELSAALTALGALARRPGTAPPVRLLLLARRGGDWLDRIHVDDDWAAEVHGSIETLSLSAPAWDQPSREREFVRAMEAFAARLGVVLPSVRPQAPAPQELESPLDLHGAALEAVLDLNRNHENGSAGTEPDVFGRVLGRERGYWRRTAKAFQLAPADLGRFDQTAAAATLFGAADHAEAVRTLGALPAFRGAEGWTMVKYIDWAQSMYQGPAALSALRPRRLGEIQVAQVLIRHPDFLECLPSVSDAQAFRALTVLGRALARDQRVQGHIAAALRTAPDRLVPLALDAVLALEEPAALVAEIAATLRDAEAAVLDRALDALPQRSTVLAQLAADMTRWARTAHRARADADPLKSALSARRFAQRHNYLGANLDEALAAASEAVDRFAQLSRTDPALVAELAEAQAVSALLLNDTGRHAEALVAGAAALATYRRLPPGAERRHTAGLATALNNQAIRATRQGDRQTALAHAQEAVDLAKGLVVADRQAHLSLLADALDTLATVTADRGAALDVGAETLALRRELAARRPDAYESQLAATSYNLSVLSARAGRLEDARELATAALAHYERAVNRHPGRFEGELAKVRRALDRLDPTEGSEEP
ncbi:TIR domain-containing protein [Streptomyces sp. NPDC059949]|uniref:TIR domain-containing protein n=1 Tax=Streptomyces sp. NPDC059949 TaxID=3347013 RepID=UPI00364C0DBA